MKRTTLIYLVCLLMAACSKSHHDEALPTAKPTLSIYVYAPDVALPTRGSGDVEAEATAGENRIYQLQIWVFRTDNKALVGHLKLTGDQLANMNSALRGEVYRMEVPESFAQAESSQRPHVDVYVLANVTDDNCGTTADETTTGSTLELMTIGDGHFAPQTGEPATGLPMAGMMKDVEVGGQSPVLRIATMPLQRCVSKIRFVFSSLSGRDDVNIVGAELDGGLLPVSTPLLETPAGSYADYEPATMTLFSDLGIVSKSEHPAYYLYNGNLADYVDNIDKAVSRGEMTEAPAVYLRESDRQLSGAVYYQVGSDANLRSARFSMSATGNFARNHMWVVYGYFTAAQLELSAVDVAEWADDGEHAHDVYNW